MPARRHFGTDGVRGPYGGPSVNEAFFERLGAAAGRWAGGSGAALVGRDTRFSGGPLSDAVARGLASAGLAPLDLGILPTPAVARAVAGSAAAIGAVVTASHNPAGDNGVKFFGPGGLKLTDEEEAAVEAALAAGAGPAVRLPAAAAHPAALADYVSAVSRLLPPGALAGWRIVLDTANGATCATSPAVLRALGADVIGLGGSPDGRNINDRVGSEFPGPLAEAVRSSSARLGVAHDGDGDRCVLVDEAGSVLDGDEILAILATDALARGRLAAGVLVATVQSNLGLDAAVAAAGGRVVRTPVGDRYVSERMRAEGANLGGESSGHIIFSDVSPAGDGLVAALRIASVMRETGRPLSDLRRVLRKFPQASSALAVRAKPPIEGLRGLSAAIAALERELGSRGRVLVRYSGTEAKLRLLVEGPTDDAVRRGLAGLAEAVRAEGILEGS
jgi:phosphoglucosamine mutase